MSSFYDSYIRLNKFIFGNPLYFPPLQKANSFSENYLKETFDKYMLCIAEKAVNVKGMSAF
ncbi:hypothetical protein KAI36_00609 [Paenibacillus sp. S02]|nr:hypothetical protein KAI36_00609 [Paenibacillus sp. S02]